MSTSGETSESFQGVTNISANQVAAANANCVATLAATAGKKTYLTGVLLKAGFAAAAGTVLATIAGVAGGTISVVVGWGTALGDTVPIQFDPPLPSSAVNTAIVVTIPATGAAGPAVSALATGYYS